MNPGQAQIKFFATTNKTMSPQRTHPTNVYQNIAYTDSPFKRGRISIIARTGETLSLGKVNLIIMGILYIDDDEI